MAAIERERDGCREDRKRRKLGDSESEKSSFTLRRCSEISGSQILGLTSPKEIKIRDKYGPQVGDTVDLLSLLFTDSADSLVKFNGQKVNIDDLNGKIIVLLMLSLAQCCCGQHHYVRGLMDFVDSYNELRVHDGQRRRTVSGIMDFVDSFNELRAHDGVEFVFVPKRGKHNNVPKRGKHNSLHSNEECFNALFSKMPWPAVPYSNKQKRRQIQTVFWPRFPVFLNSPCYVVLDPKGKVLLTNTYRYRHRQPRPSIFHLYGGSDLFSLADLGLRNLKERDKQVINILDLDQLLASPYRDFLLASDGTKVPVSSLRDKVVGLYFCDNIKFPPNMGALKKVYREAMDMGYDFEIVQINFHFRNNYEVHPHNKETPLQVCCEDIPWLTLPFRDICCRRLRRLFKYHKELDNWDGDSLVIIDPHEPNVDGTHFDRFATDIVRMFGIEGYPFTRRRVFEMEHEEKMKVRLHTILLPGGPPLIRPSRGWDRVSRFEVVYVSSDRDESTFDEVIKEMPWLVHPYSWEFSQRWGSDSEFALLLPPEDLLVAFDKEGELLTCEDDLNLEYYSADGRLRLSDSYPFVRVDMVSFILGKVARKYGAEDRLNFSYIESIYYPPCVKHDIVDLGI